MGAIIVAAGALTTVAAGALATAEENLRKAVVEARAAGDSCWECGLGTAWSNLPSTDLAVVVLTQRAADEAGEPCSVGRRACRRPRDCVKGVRLRSVALFHQRLGQRH